MSKAKTLRAAVRTMASIDVWCEPEDMAIRGSFDSGDDAADEEQARSIERDLADGNEWAWCSVTVHVVLRSPRGKVLCESTQYLGGCSYASKADFVGTAKDPGDYYSTMVSEALDEIMVTVELDMVATLRTLGYSVKRGAK